jgi:hypothetical protein
MIWYWLYTNKPLFNNSLIMLYRGSIFIILLKIYSKANVTLFFDFSKIFMDLYLSLLEKFIIY